MISLSEEFRKVPLLKVVLPFIAGIVFEMKAGILWNYCLYLFIFSLTLLLLVSIWNFSKSYSRRHIWGLASTLVCFSAGMYLFAIKVKDSEISNDLFHSKLFVAEVNDLPIKREQRCKTTIEILWYKYDNKWIKADYDCKLQVNNIASDFELNPGDKIVINSVARDIDFPITPYQFNYKKYLYYNGIQCQILAQPRNIAKIWTSQISVSNRILQLRQILLAKLNSYKMAPREKAVLSSLVLGFVGEIDPELRNAFSASGVMHILSVSGLHVGIVYIFLSYLLFFLNKNSKLQILKSALIICGIWFYAIISGFSPPVIRSAAMFSLFAFGQAINRNNNSFNTLAASALLILLMNPFQIVDIGFQLTYAAMTSIFIFYEPLYNAWEPSSQFMDKIWAIIAVSLAAQITTLPLTLFYFHQFPVYFLLANLIIVPLSGIILYTGLAMLILSFIPKAVTLIGFLLKYQLLLLNWLVLQTEHLPGSLITGIHLDTTETILFYAIIASLALWYFLKGSKFLIVFLLFLLCLTAQKSFHSIASKNQTCLVVHNVPNRLAVSIINKDEMLTISDSAIASRIEKSSPDLKLNLGIKKQYKISFIGSNSFKDTVISGVSIHKFAGDNIFLQISNKKIVLLNDKKIFTYTCKRPQKIDFLICNLKIDSSLLKKLNCVISGKIIVTQKRVPKTTMSHHKGTALYFTTERGAFIKDL